MKGRILMKRTVGFIAAGLSILSFGASAAFAVEITIGAFKDNIIYSDNVDNSNGAGPRLDIGRNMGGAFRRSLIAFDVAGSIPSGSTINSARLEIYNFNNTNITETHNYDVFSLLADWGEGTSNSSMGMGAPATTGDATWNARFFDTTSPVLWTTPGGDFAASPSASIDVAAATVNTFLAWESAALTSDVQDWLDDSASNFGWILIGDETTTEKSVRDFRSRDFTSDVTLRPKLTIDFTPVPEPSVLVLAGLGAFGFAVLRWRRKSQSSATTSRFSFRQVE